MKVPNLLSSFLKNKKTIIFDGTKGFPEMVTMRFQLIALLIQLAASFSHAADTKDILSPDGKTKVSVEVNPGVRYAITYETNVILKPSIINLEIGDRLS